jgi:hypothetical protein
MVPMSNLIEWFDLGATAIRATLGSASARRLRGPELQSDNIRGATFAWSKFGVHRRWCSDQLSQL